MKKLKLSLISLIVLSLLLSACTKEKTSTAENDEPKKDEPPHEITMFYPVGNKPTGIDDMLVELNKITKEKINTIIHIKTAPNWNRWESQSNQAIVDGEDIDLMLTTTWDLQNRVAKDFLLPLDRLIEEKGEDILDIVGPEILKVTTFDREIYAVPSATGWARARGLTVDRKLLDKYHIDYTKIKTIDDFEGVFKKIRGYEGNKSYLSDVSAELFMADNLFDPLGDLIGVLPMDTDDLQLVNLFETKAYKDSLYKIYEWYNAGYIRTRDQQDQNDRPFAYGTVLMPWWRGENRVAIEITPPVMTEDTIEMYFSILKTSKNPEKAMEFLNLMYTDKKIVNLLSWGVEGEHYVKIDENTVTYPEGIDANNPLYEYDYAGIFGNQFLSYKHDWSYPNLREQQIDFNERALRSKAFGFRFNPESVQEEVRLLSSMIIRHRKRLESGTLDPEVYLPDFIERLKNAGIDKVIAEKQRQLDEWAALQ